jgi:hypothetical protein
MATRDRMVAHRHRVPRQEAVTAVVTTNSLDRATTTTLKHTREDQTASQQDSAAANRARDHSAHRALAATTEMPRDRLATLSAVARTAVSQDPPHSARTAVSQDRTHSAHRAHTAEDRQEQVTSLDRQAEQVTSLDRPAERATSRQPTDTTAAHQAAAHSAHRAATKSSKDNRSRSISPEAQAAETASFTSPSSSKESQSSQRTSTW